jgi:hypothetical protein
LAASLRHSDKCTSSETAPGHTSGAVNLGTGFLPARGNGGIGPEAGIRRVAELSVPPIATFSRRRRVQKGQRGGAMGSGEQFGAGRRELHVGSGIVDFEPAPRNCAIEARRVFRGRAFVAE